MPDLGTPGRVPDLRMPALAVAVLVQERWTQATFKTAVALVLLLLVNAVLTHATARAARIRMHGDWPPEANEHFRQLNMQISKQEKSGVGRRKQA